LAEEVDNLSAFKDFLTEVNSSGQNERTDLKWPPACGPWRFSLIHSSIFEIG
jgi:hypothetical protein